MIEFLIEILAYIVFSYPGAGFRWLISRFWKSEKTFKELHDENIELNGALGLIIIALPIIIYNLI
ncbi:hypothetical protein [Lacinutrix algicola]|uniref:hypothetical protein n=1 Tax=Lacinutrix algicola TaxID=342954 RepID=UPI0006E15A66|nr:hypothetical protein [Lacinutrix algicola]